MRRFLNRSAALSAAALLAVPPQAWADGDAPKCSYQTNPTLCNPNQRQVNIVGATLFRAFFEAPASTNDFIDVDKDGCSGFGNPNCFPNNVDQLAIPFDLTSNSWWIVQHRSVGSVQGFEEFVTWHLCCDLDEIPPTERSTINHVLYFDPNAPAPGYVYPGAICQDDTDGDGLPSQNGSPVCPCSADIAIVDVVSSWVVTYPGDPNNPAHQPMWSKKPTQPGYGLNYLSTATVGTGCAANGGEISKLDPLARDCDNDPNTPPVTANFNFGNPDQNTIYDTTICFAAVVPISNRGTGVVNITYTDLQYLNIAGRNSKGINYAVVTRDVGSGTRNGWCNSIGVDPSWGNGDRRGSRTTSQTQTNLGPCHRTSLCGSSSHVENATQQRRLAIGYTGISGNTSAAADANAGLYEILNVIKDIAPYNATVPVRPTVSSMLDNSDPNKGYTIGGPVSFPSFGDPNVTDPNLPQYMENQDAADYLRNIVASIDNFTDPTGISDPNNNLMPGQYLAQTFFLIGAQDAEQSLIDPTLFVPYNPDPNQAGNPVLQEYIRANNNLGVSTLPKNGIVTPDYGSRNTAGLVPNRAQGAYVAWNGSTFASFTANSKLPIACRIQGDFNYDFKRDASDIAQMLVALKDPNAWMQANVKPNTPDPNDLGDWPINVAIPEIIGDMDGNGLFEVADIRYVADGLIADPITGNLNRKLAFTEVDNKAPAAGFSANFFGTVIKLPSQCGGGNGTYTAGDSRFDVTGSAIGPAMGDAPIGADGIVDDKDFAYILKNFGDWTDINQAVFIDLSCDMNGDLKIDAADVAEFLSGAWGLVYGDLNCDGKVCQEDLGVLLANYGSSGATYFQGDLNGDGSVGQADLGSLLAAYGTGGC